MRTAAGLPATDQHLLGEQFFSAPPPHKTQRLCHRLYCLDSFMALPHNLHTAEPTSLLPSQSKIAAHTTIISMCCPLGVEVWWCGRKREGRQNTQIGAIIAETEKIRGKGKGLRTFLASRATNTSHITNPTAKCIFHQIIQLLHGPKLDQRHASLKLKQTRKRN